MKETHTITTIHDIPDDIREALKIREDLDGVSGELLGYETLGSWSLVGHYARRVFAPPLFFLLFFALFNLPYVFYSQPDYAFYFFLVFVLVGKIVSLGGLEYASFGEKAMPSKIGFNKCKPKIVSMPFALGHTQCVFMNHQIAYTKVQHISVVAVKSLLGTKSNHYSYLKRPCIRIHVAGTRAPIEVMLDKRMKREAEWLVNQIQARMAAVQSGTVPEDLTRLTKQAGATGASSRPVNASATNKT